MANRQVIGIDRRRGFHSGLSPWINDNGNDGWMAHVLQYRILPVTCYVCSMNSLCTREKTLLPSTHKAWVLCLEESSSIAATTSSTTTGFSDFVRSTGLLRTSPLPDVPYMLLSGYGMETRSCTSYICKFCAIDPP
eukprot:Gb_40111 [translate_table: standard]